MNTFAKAEPEVILSAWEVQALDDAGEWQPVAQEATKAAALFAAQHYLASGCTVRVVWRT